MGIELETIRNGPISADRRNYMPTATKAKISRISIEDVKKRLGELTFVDARSATALSRNPVQVPGAIHFPAKEVGNGLKRLPRNRTLVTYCT